MNEDNSSMEWSGIQNSYTKMDRQQPNTNKEKYGNQQKPQQAH